MQKLVRLSSVLRRALVFVPVAAVAACTASEPALFIHKPGVSVAGKQAALDECRIASLREIPQTVVSQTSGGYYNPGTLQCNTVGGITNCYRVGAVNIAPTTTTRDVNEDLRARYINRCLREKGFSLTAIPRCVMPSEIAASNDAQARGDIPKCATGAGLRR